MEAWFLSDIHLKSADERNGRILLRFLISLREQNPENVHLFLLGDIFDLWVGGHEYFIKKFQPIIDALFALKKAGAKIIYIEGNHDMHIESFFARQLGAEVFVESRYFELGDLVIRCEHGDLINLDDSAYLRYRSVVRHPFVKLLGVYLPGRFWSYVGTKMSQKSRKVSGNYRLENEARLISMIRHHVIRAYSERPFDFIISGHMHVIDDFETQIQGNKVRSINLGSWVDKKVKVFGILDGRGEWVELTEK